MLCHRFVGDLVQQHFQLRGLDRLAAFQVSPPHQRQQIARILGGERRRGWRGLAGLTFRDCGHTYPDVRYSGIRNVHGLTFRRCACQGRHDTATGHADGGASAEAILAGGWADKLSFNCWSRIA
jgi:hypothetical protein